MSATGDYAIWLREHAVIDSEASRAAYMAERESAHRAHTADECSGGGEAHEAHMELNDECPWDARERPVVIADSSYAETRSG